jgi:uncharacterized LabA/DUF88 family protein
MRVALFFDGKNFFRALEKHDPYLEVSYDNLAKWIVDRVAGADGKFVGAYYYTGYNKTRGGGVRGEAFGKFLNALEYRPGFFVRREPRVRRQQRRGGKTRYYWTEKRVDTRLVAEMIQLAAVDAYDCAVLFSGDQDLVPAVEAVHALGKQVWLGHWARGGVSKELRRRCFYEIDLTEGAEAIGTGRVRARIAPVSTPPTQVVAVTVFEVEPPADASAPPEAEVLTAVLAAVTDGAAHFARTNGHLSEWFFVHRWKADGPCPLQGTDERAQAVGMLIEGGSVEAYEYEDAKQRSTRALRPVAGQPPASSSNASS